MYLVATGIAAARADLVVSVSDASARDVHRFSGRRAVVCYPTLPARPCPPERSRRPAQEQPYVLFNGGMDPRKNLRVLVDAFALFSATPTGSAFRLAVLGDVPEDVVGQHNAAGIGDRCAWPARCPTRRSGNVGRRGAGGCGPPASTMKASGWLWPRPSPAAPGSSPRRAARMARSEAEQVVRIDLGDARSLAAGLAAAVDPDQRAALVAAGFDQLERLRSRSAGILSTIESSTSRVGAKSLLYGRRRAITRARG